MKKYNQSYPLLYLSKKLNIHPSGLISKMYNSPSHRQRVNHNQIVLPENYISYLNEQTPELTPYLALIIDDDEDFYNFINNVFINIGYKTLWAKDGLEASYLIAKYAPSLITLDLKMNVLNGHQVLDIMNRLEKIKRPWTIIISADNLSEIENGIGEGADFFLQKPINISKLTKIASKIQETSVTTINQ